MILDTDALEALRSTLATRGVTSLTDEDPTDAEYLWALVQDLTEARAELATTREKALEVENASREYFGFWGGQHSVGCPEDDTCDCEPLTRFCDALTELYCALRKDGG